VLSLAASVACLAQGVTLGISSGSASRGAPVALNISLNTTGTSLPVALQWTLNYSTLDFPSATVTAGPVALTANKSITCNNNNAGAITCVLWGLNAVPISNGDLATISLIVSNSTTNTSSPIELTSSVASDAQGNAVTTSSSNGAVAIQQPITAPTPAFDVQSRSLGPLTASAGQGANQNQQGSLDVTNNTLNPLQLSLSANVPWIRTNSPSNPLPPGLNHGAIAISIDATQLQASSNPYAGTLTVSSGSLSIPILLTVQVSGIALVAAPNAINMSVAAGGVSPSQAISVVKSSDNATLLSFSATPSDPSWIKVTPSNGTTPSMLSIGIDASRLSAGPHSGTITLACPGTASCQSLVLSVAATVIETKLLVNQSSVSFQAFQGRFNPRSQTVMLTTSSGTELGFTITGTPAWLQVSPANGMASATPSVLTITAIAGALSPGTNTASITLTPANNTEPITLNISAVLSPFSIRVTPNPPPPVRLTAGQMQTISFAIGTADNSVVDVQIATSTNNTGNWLSIAANDFSVPGQATVTFDARALGTGNYSGTVTFSCAAANCTPVQIPISATVSSTPTISASSTSLSLQPGVGGSLPTSQKVSLNASDQSAQDFSLTYSPQGSWLKVTSDRNTTPAILTVEAVSLSGQNTSGTITIKPANGSPAITIPVNLLLLDNNAPRIQGVITASAFGGFRTISPGTYIEIYGSNFSSTSRVWTSADFTGVNAPTALDGVTVTINGQPAYVNYVSPGQVNVLVPGNLGADGPAQLILSNSAGSTSSYSVDVAPLQPGLLAPSGFVINGKQYVAALFPDGTLVLPAGALPGVASRPAKPGETIILYGVGFGSVVEDTPVGTIAKQENTMRAPLQILFGQTPAMLRYDGLMPSSVGVYQINMVVPPVPDSDVVPLTFNLGGVTGSQTLSTAVHH
jgi:uncharacterized protein (TIGR03437 family)